MAVGITLDPSEVATARTQFALTPWMGEEVDWGDAEVTEYEAEARLGSLPIDYTVPNRIVSIPLVLRAAEGLTFDVVRTRVQAKVALFQREGGWVKRTTNLGDVFADVVGATLTLGGIGFMEDTRKLDVDAVLTLECIPDWYGAEIDLGSTSETTAKEWRRTFTGVKGNYPGRTRIIVNELQGASQRGLIWGMRSENYSAATGLSGQPIAALAYEAEALTPLDRATYWYEATHGASPSTNATGTGNITNGSTTVSSVTNTSQWQNGMRISGTGIPATYIVSGAGTATMIMANPASATTTGVAITGLWDSIRHAFITSDWTPILSTSTKGADLVHVGTYRVWARIYAPPVVAPAWGVAAPARSRVRFTWDVGDMTLPNVNDVVTLPNVSGFCTVDLGEIRLEQPPTMPVVTHRWRGILQGQAPSGADEITVDKVWFVPQDDGYGVLRATATDTQGLSAFTARDAFNQTAGALAGKALDVGGTWSGAGDADDFAVNATTHTADRTATADGGGSGDMRVGRWAIAGTTVLTDTFVQVSESYSVGYPTWGAFARYTDINNWVACRVAAATTFTIVNVVTASGGTLTSVVEYDYTSLVQTAGVKSTIRMFVDAGGRLRVWFYPTGVVDASGPVIDAWIPDLAVGGFLASGKVGFWEEYTSSGSTRSFDDFLAWVPSVDAVEFASQSAEVHTEGAWREDAAGVAYGPIADATGGLPRIPPSGLEARTVELMVLTSRGDYAQQADTNIDDLSVQVLYRPCWLVVPE